MEKSFLFHQDGLPVCAVFFCCCLSANFLLFSMPGTKRLQNSSLKMGAIGTREPDGRGAAFELAMDHLGPDS